MALPHFPPDFSNYMQIILKEEYKLFLETHSLPSPTSIRINKEKGNYNPASLKPVKWCDTGFYLEKRPSFALDPLWHGGSYYVQEASSMFLEQFLNFILPTFDKPIVLDLCAAPGGKSTLIASLLPDDGLLLSNEINRQRSHILAENIRKWGSGNVMVTCNDPKSFESLPDFFDVIVIDAPCSGEGMFRKDPSAIDEWSLKNVQICAERQKKIISDVWGSLKEDGIIIYSTCTYNKEENEEILKWVSKNYEIEIIKIPIPKEWNICEISEEDIYGYRFYPQRLQGEGLFMAAFIKKESNGRKNVRTNQKSLLNKAGKSDIDRIPDWLENTHKWFKGKIEEKIILLPEGYYKTAERIYQQLYVVHAGVELAEIIRTQANPLPDFALFKDVNPQCFPIENVDLETAHKFLKREDIAVSETAKGWILIAYQNVNLGWIKKSGNKITNYYPKEWRLRMDWKEIDRISFQ